MRKDRTAYRYFRLVSGVFVEDSARRKNRHIERIYALVLAPLIVVSTPSQPEVYVAPIEQIEVREEITIPQIMEEIAWCESRNRQFNDDGTVLRGKENSKDVGKWQINEYYHLETAKSLGMDIYTLEGNTAYALYLYETQGTAPWIWSKPCWSAL